MKQEVYDIKWKQPWAASAQHRAQITVWIGKEMMQIGGPIWSGRDDDKQIITTFSEEIVTEINRVIETLSVPEDAAMITMWQGDIAWVRSAEFEQLFNQKIQTMWDM